MHVIHHISASLTHTEMTEGLYTIHTTEGYRSLVRSTKHKIILHKRVTVIIA